MTALRRFCDACIRIPKSGQAFSGTFVRNLRKNSFTFPKNYDILIMLACYAPAAPFLSSGRQPGFQTGTLPYPVLSMRAEYFERWK